MAGAGSESGSCPFSLDPPPVQEAGHATSKTSHCAANCFNSRDRCLLGWVVPCLLPLGEHGGYNIQMGLLFRQDLGIDRVPRLAGRVDAGAKPEPPPWS
ncbi:hypothetical protein AAFF_G00094080 [Aldrovandia affinis]|uniref:Uncharacterized protein n=1 Tax=Aldrovandia affinis TaxID=143900 RepID=A0AAD7WY20_9TELE|nr:hypothetical protein AAFF_G00094080 [Aldrovandia affinis]